MNHKILSVFDLEGKDLEKFLEKYGDIFEPKYVDLEYYKLYYLGKFDHDRLIFEYMAQTYEIDKVLYPGSFIHITPSFDFENVTYVDIYPNIEDFFSDEDVLKYIELHKNYQSPTTICYKEISYVNLEGQYDLIISSNAGSVSIDCKKNLKNGGYLLVNNGHSDADNAFADDAYEYLGYFKFNINKDHVQFILDNTSYKSSDFCLFRKL
ncbi:MAG: hypothetical protein JXR88_11775 [Clostridia bacterium]|nr:hypothetical protein [Clostridia bacterium]